MKTEVYSWRLSASHKADLEERARREGKSLGGLLHEITSDWLAGQQDEADDDGQAALRKRVMATVGTIRSGDPTGSVKAGQIARDRILRKHPQQS